MTHQTPVKRTSDDAVLLQKRLFIARHPAENLRFIVQLLDEVVNIEIYCYVRLILAGARYRAIWTKEMRMRNVRP